MKVYIANNPEALQGLGLDATVEAEFGADCVKGRLTTLAHHGPRSGNPAPCVWKEEIPEGIESVGISHVDLDTVGGVMRLLGDSPSPDSTDELFWQAAARMDVEGPHRLEEILRWARSRVPFDCGAVELYGEVDDVGQADGILDCARDDVVHWIRDALYAYWAYSKEHRVFPPRDGSVDDVTDKVMEHVAAVRRILGGDKRLLDAGKEFRFRETSLNADSLIRVVPTHSGLRIAVREAEEFTNHLYRTVDGVVCDGVVALNTKFKSITLSWSEGQGDACKIMQAVFGPKAGGHAGIAGDPRDKEARQEDLEVVVRHLQEG